MGLGFTVYFGILIDLVYTLQTPEAQIRASSKDPGYR